MCLLRHVVPRKMEARGFDWVRGGEKCVAGRAASNAFSTWSVKFGVWAWKCAQRWAC